MTGADKIYYDARYGMVAGRMLEVSDEIQAVADDLAGVTCAEIGPAVLTQAANEAAQMWASGAGKLAAGATQLGQQIKDEVATYDTAENEAMDTFRQAFDSGTVPKEVRLPPGGGEVPRVLDDSTGGRPSR